jgi:hypothetical protein
LGFFSTKNFWRGEVVLLQGGFTFSAVFLDGNLWSVRGDFVVKRGVLTDTFGALRICRLFQLYFGSSLVALSQLGDRLVADRATC